MTNAVYGFTGMLIKALQDHKTEYLAVAFDKGPPLERLAIRPEYKAQRTAAPDEFRQQVDLIREVLKVLGIQKFEIPNVEADDIISIIGSRIAEEGNDVILVTADRDYFQMVGPNVKLMMNKRGISETVVYDVAAVQDRYGFGPERYLDYAALRGDPSDNIEGVPGVGEKTAAKLIQTYGTLEEIFGHLDELTPKIRANLAEASERLLVNREFFRFRTSPQLAASGVDPGMLDVSVEDLHMAQWDFGEIRTLFDALEFRVLYERLTAGRPEAIEAGEGFEAEVRELADEDSLRAFVDEMEEEQNITLRLIGESGKPREPATVVAFAAPGGAAVARVSDSMPADVLWKTLAPLLETRTIATHGSKEALQRLAAVGIVPAGVVMDTEIAAYLVEPARGTYRLDELARQYLNRELRLDSSSKPPDEESQSTLFAAPQEVFDPSAAGLEALAVSELSQVLDKELRNRGAFDLFNDLELPLAGVLAEIEHAGIRVDVEYLEKLSSSISVQLTEIERQIYALADGPFNIGSPPQLREVLYTRLALKPTKKTKTGFSTDASVLESLRDSHPIVDLILQHREKAKLRSTYLDALPPLVDPKTGRVHGRFNQTVAATGRLSSEAPNMQNIPIRTEEGKQIRRAFIAEPGYKFVVADYSQIELRILAHLSEDEELVAAFNRGDDIHKLSISKALGIEISEVSYELRAIGKMVSYGVTYGMGPFGLSQRLKIPVDQARTYIDGFFSLYPRVRTYLDQVVARATEDGFTTTMLGRRRYVPELKSRNPRVRSLGERQALNAPIQGSAADIIKLAMVRADEAIGANDARMVLTVHDELVFEVAEAEVEEVSAHVRTAMEKAVTLRVPMEVDLGVGDNWGEAKA